MISRELPGSGGLAVTQRARALASALGTGVDAAKALKKLEALGLQALWQVPLFLPPRYLDARTPVEHFAQLYPSIRETVLVGRYTGDWRMQWGQGKGRHSPQAQGSLVDSFGRRIRFSLFGDGRALQKVLDEAGDRAVALAGTLQPVGHHLYLNNPTVVADDFLGKVVPNYPGKPRVLSVQMARRLVAALLDTAIPECARTLREFLGASMDGKTLRRLLGRPHGTLEDLLWEAHFPESPEAGEAAQTALERLSALITVNDLRRLRQAPQPVRQRIDIPPWRALLPRVPFELTGEQTKAVEMLASRFGGPVASSTLLNADVGMGKSIVYQLACAAAVQGGARVAVLLPNERLAVQAHQDIAALFPDLAPRLVTGRSGSTNESAANWLIGTTALLFRRVGEFDVCVVDEQHRFSVDQRSALAQNGTHVVEVSATPIPRTQALLLYGKLDVIRLTQRHSPQQINTRIVEKNAVLQMVHRLRGIIEEGGRVLIVCPRREDAEDDEAALDLPSVARVAEKWRQLFPGLVRDLHGESDPDAVAQAFADLADGSARVLVATTVVEVGLNIRNLRAVVIVHAERFGLSQLHQLRGRLAREGGAGVCFLYLPKPVGLDATARLEALVATNDGFELAEHDMRLRGIGDVSALGVRQHGSAGGLLMNRAVPMSTFIEVLEAVST